MNQPSDSRSTYKASGDTPIGRAGEDRVVGIVAALLTARGHSVERLPSSDSHGDDARLAVDSVEYGLQATTVPGAADFWGAAKRDGSATTVVTDTHAASWLQNGIDKKMGTMTPAQREQTILALDAQDWGAQLTRSEILGKLTDSTLNPAEKYGLAGLAVAGDTSSNSTWFPGRIK